MDPQTNPNQQPAPATPAVPEVNAVPDVQPVPAPAEMPAAAPQSAPAATPVATPPASPAPTPAAPPAAPSPAASGPAIADDVDVIEKEWVDHAEAVVKENKDDPHAEEEAVEGLQVDYLKKRYGKDITKPQES